ncbi:acyl-CoA carboxylase subunit epsilon [Actinomadura sp. DC4]|uniref:acyl-CoA carboxylase subunit epsilon n=1 Tax=Actinomadura sp. DC4 TaxID=3055069 RepID=UPI0025AF6C37|nr:acyl-CoA carboxylase subunit epsilon [Actinomadura sp. DC4]MDN3353350.1 acyl-CoA carboxylase subunit epsilon [Actinomadura sp. DC4]
MSDQQPFCQVTAGRLDPAELAALVTVLTAIARRRPPDAAPRVEPARWQPAARPGARSWQRSRGGWADAA